MNHKSQRGIALVITLIMLAVVTVMAVLFLGVSRRERASVTLTADQTTAKLAADTAQYRALAEEIGRITAQSNKFAYGMMVSTNLINPNGITPGAASFTNVSYFSTILQPLGGNNLNQMLTNLYYNPRPPVYIVTNLASGASEFRFYLDLNRNGRFDTNGSQPVLDINGQRTGQTNFFFGDPEWLGILAHPDQPHSSSNRFIARYAYVVVPAGKTLDINYLHNDAKSTVPSGFFRNQGVGSWEINLAAFLRELNTNYWIPSSYTYNPAFNPPNGGFAFTDARSILTNRYAGRFNSQKSANQDFGTTLAGRFRTDQIDYYSDGPLMTGIKSPVESGNADNPAQAWAGSDNTNGFVSIEELFDPKKTSVGFTNRLRSALARQDSYDRDTFYRLLSQIGTDSLPANRNKLNLNYDNVDANGAINPSLATNFTQWTPMRFFTNAADQMLRTQTQFGIPIAITNIPVYPTNFYTASVHRLLQLAANISENNTNRLLLAVSGTNNLYAPSVFRPVFSRKSTNIFIAGYQEVTGTNFLRETWVDLNFPATLAMSQIPEGTITTNINVYGVPLVIGAKKGFPNFNEFLLQTSVQVTRRLQAFKPDLKKPNVFFQQSYEIGISNYLALEAWNSYTQAFPRALDVLVTNRVWLSLSNASAPVVSTVTSNSFLTTSNFTIANNLWAGKEFRVPMSNTVALVPDWEFHFQKPYLRVPRDNVTFDPINLGFPVPDWKLYVTNRLQFILIDKASGRIVDYVNFDRMMGGMDITRALAGETNLFGDPGLQPGAFWLTNHLGNVANAMTWGITNQIYVSTNNVLARADWTSYTDNPIDGKSKEKAVDDFRKFLGLPPLFDLTNTNPPTGNTVQVPFTPTRKLDQQLSWQVNDPLVHYTMEDLYDPFYADTNAVQALKPGQRAETNNIGQPNDRSRPWGGKSTKDPSSNPLAYDLAIKDPLIANSDDWDFPTNKFPNIGWLGRVHRGTPWQTVYLKSSVEPTNSWGKWAGRFDTHPTNDWHLVGLFTTAPNDNAARGLLSVNQTNSAAWSAVLGGVSVLTNTVPGNPNTQLAPTYASMLIEPVSPQLNYIVTNINAARLQQPGQVFRDLGSVLASTNLTTGSPFLNLSSDPQNKRSVSDEVYERIPQQILSLLKEDEPFLVIYSFGQSLRPAADSIVRTPGVYRNLCTNYQVTGEVVTKTAVRIDEIPQPPKQPLRYKAVVESYSILPSD